MGAITLVIILLKVALVVISTSPACWLPAGLYEMYTICRYPYARPGGGLGAAFGGEAGYPKLMGLYCRFAGRCRLRPDGSTAAVITIALGADSAR